MESKDTDIVVEMDTVIGRKDSGNRLLTMIFRKNSVMLAFLLPDVKAESVNHIFDTLENCLGFDIFKQLFPVILTDNGSEFKRVDGLELTDDYEYRTRIFYCVPQAEITLLTNHINSYKLQDKNAHLGVRT